MDKELKVAQDMVVWLDMKLRDMQNDLIDESPKGGTPVLIGHEDLLPAVEQALMGKGIGEEIFIHLEPEQAFGEYDPELIHIVDDFLLGDHVEPGMKVEGIPGQKNDGRIYTVSDVSEDKIVLDGNHPLAGYGLKVEAKILKIEQPTEEEIEQMEEDDLMPDLLEVPASEKVH